MLSYKRSEWRVKQRGPQMKGEMFDEKSALRGED